MDLQEELRCLERLGLLRTLLTDRTTRLPIIWGTDEYADLGLRFSRDAAVTPEALLQSGFELCPEAERNGTWDQTAAFAKAKSMAVSIASDWFGREDAFDSLSIPFSGTPGRTWEDYIRSRQIQPDCGEGTCLATRLSPETGIDAPVRRRTGLLDLKLQVCNERVPTPGLWKRQAMNSLRSVYGFEYRGDSLLIARLNLLATLRDFKLNRWGQDLDLREYQTAAEVISWNLWQMDRATCCPPSSISSADQISIFGFQTEDEPGTGSCRIRLWSGSKWKTAAYSVLADEGLTVFDRIV